jgi:hypothetical protein
MQFNEQAVRWWIEELESGEYPQTSGCLHRKKIYEDGIFSAKKGFCCLGVACLTAIKHGVELRVEEDDEHGIITYDGEKEGLPDAVVEFLGLEPGDPDPEIGDHKATVLNDENVYSLAEIAREIRRHWLGEDVPSEP